MPHNGRNCVIAAEELFGATKQWVATKRIHIKSLRRKSKNFVAMPKATSLTSQEVAASTEPVA
jgi:hypothetical protein